MKIRIYNKKIKESIERVESLYQFASLFIQRVERGSLTISSKEESSSFSPAEIGFVYKAFNGSFFREYASSDFSIESIEKAEKYLMDHYVTGGEYEIDAGEEIESSFEHVAEIRPEDVDISEYLVKARKNREIVESLSDKIVDSMVHLGYEIKEEVYINRSRDLYQKLRRFDSVFSATFKDGSNIAEIYGGLSKRGGFEFADLDFDMVKREVAKGEEILYAERLKPGFYDCILSPSLSGMLAHESFGHGTESDMFLKKRAKGAEYFNRRVASEKLNMWDAPTLELSSANASYFFDSEGQLAKDTEIIKDGILINSITDLYSATILGFPVTSNSRLESYSHKVYPRMTNTYFSKGRDKLEDMIKSIEFGYLIDSATNGMEDPKNWGVQLEASIAREIVDGKLTGRVYSPVILTGYLPDILGSITHISDDFEISMLGYCGKGHKEWVKVTDGGPYIKLKLRLA